MCNKRPLRLSITRKVGVSCKRHTSDKIYNRRETSSRLQQLKFYKSDAEVATASAAERRQGNRITDDVGELAWSRCVN